MKCYCELCGKVIPETAARISLPEKNTCICCGCEGAEIDVFKVSLGGSFYISKDLGGVMDELENMQEGDEFTVSRFRMKYVEFATLPEFDGF